MDLLKESKEELENGANILKKLIEKQADNKSFKQIKTSFLTNYYAKNNLFIKHYNGRNIKKIPSDDTERKPI